MRLNLLLLLSVSLLITTSCSSKLAQAEYIADKFYNMLMQRQFDEIRFLLDTEAIVKQPFDQWVSTFHALRNQRGIIQEYRKSAIQTFHDKNKNLIVKITYKVNYKYGIFFETLTLIKRGKDFKILTYEY